MRIPSKEAHLMEIVIQNIRSGMRLPSLSE